MMRKTKTQFKPISLGKDERSIKEEIRQKKSKLEPIGKLYKETIDLLGVKLTPAQFFDAIHKGSEGFASHLRAKTSLPNATADILFQMHGLNNDFIKNLVIRYKDTGLTAMEETQLEFRNDEFHFPQSVYDGIESRYTFQTENQTQNQAFETLLKLSESLEEVIDNGFVTVTLEHSSFHVKSKYTILKVLDDTLTIENGKIVPNRSFILGLQEA